ncbi:ORF3 polyprotein [Cacao swollen shoot Ghana N virus]|uniref:RNA-directed DNA polymerase n=3 Tax=Cacao swollen shoot Ghana N virus TaxID=2056884 RepID=A0A2H4U952_9VIRU|nr:ORF3 polyprotein [Cacao swollen shoot Ghana N virus]ATZ69486.1 ORF3 polyprotein [Cacao swollen shoot Ghana N virus]
MSRTQTVQENPSVTDGRGRQRDNTPLFEDQVRDYRQNQRRLFNLQRATRRLRGSVTGRRYQDTLEQEVDPQAALRLSMQERARLVPAEVLYRSRRDTVHHRVYTHRSEESILCTDGNQIDRTFIQPESLERLQRSGMAFIHIGILQVRIQILHRQEEGTMALVVFRDNRWEGDQSIFATMEVDLTHGSQLVFVIPDTMMTIGDFARNVQLSILTRGYQNWQNGEANLLITRSMTGRLSNTPNVAFAYQISDVTDYLASHGVKAIAGKKYDLRGLQGQQWVLRPPRANITPMQPNAVETRNLVDGSISLRFHNYEAAPTTSRPTYNEHDEEVESEEESELREHIVAAWVGPEEFPDNTGRIKVWEESCNGNGRFYRYYTAPPVYTGEVIATGWDDDETPPKWDECPDEKSDHEGSNEDDDDDPNTYMLRLQLEEESWREIETEVRNEIIAGGKEELEYPTRGPTTEVVLSSEVVDYNPPADTLMTPVGYPPASIAGPSNRPARPPLFEGYSPQVPKFKAEKYSEWWQLPSSQGTTGAMFVMPRQIGMFHDVFSRWESITKNYVAAQGFTDTTEKAEFIENLLGETEKLTWIQWRMNYAQEYQQLLTQSDGRQGTQNILSQMKRVFSLEDPASGSTRVQDDAYRDLERLSCNNIKDIIQFLNDYGRLAAKSGRMFVGTELSEKLWLKMPPELGTRMREAFHATYAGNEVGVFPRILFAYKYLEQECKDAAFKRSLKSLSFCRDIPITGYYDKTRKYGIRKSKSYKGKPHETHARIEKRKHLVRNKRCKCYLCGEEGHFARECPNSKRDVRRVAIFEGVDIPEDYDIISVDEGEPESDAIYSISENENNDLAEEEWPVERAYMFREVDQTYWLGKKNHWTAMVKVTAQQYNCMHHWEHNQEIKETAYLKCYFCKQQTMQRSRIHCPRCTLTACFMCAPIYCNTTVQKTERSAIPYNPHALLQEQQGYIQWLEAENKRLAETVQNYQKQIADLKLTMELEASRQELEQTAPKPHGKGISITDETIAYLEEDVKITGHGHEQVAKPVRGNMLYNMDVILNIPDVGRSIKVKAILDTGATTCCINIDSVPKSAIEQNTFLVHFKGINSSQTVDKKLKFGKMLISGHHFRIPYCYAFPLKLGDGIEMILGCNFIRGMYGGLRIEGTTVTFYKNVTTIQTRLAAPAVYTDWEGGGDNSQSQIQNWWEEEDEPVDLETHQQIMLLGAIPAHPITDPKLGKLLAQLKEQGYIGENPMQHWAQNKVVCKLEIKNPDLIIEDRPIKHLTPAMEQQFQKHIKALLDIGVIRPSKSRHRTTAFIVQSGTTIDQETKQVIHGKERMVFNYKRLNDNTEKDQYSLPGIQTILKKIGNKQVFSKFDLKSGFHQVAMAEESIPWTAFWVPQGLYEWLVMPFGLKNAPAIFQRKMDQCFKGTEDFIAVYIDDILVFSNNMADHIKHVQTMLRICQEHGLVLSQSKMKLAQEEMEFLGTTIGRGKMRLQPHIIKKLINYSDSELETTKGLRSFLGILNYARIYIPNLGRKLSPLYAKTSPTGERRFNKQDWQVIKEIKAMVQALPDLSIPPAQSCIIVESDGCMEGWGAICKWKTAKEDPRSTEKICAYASGKFGIVKSTIDAEIHAIIKALESFKIFYLDKKRLIVRTDCQAIVTFYNKSVGHKPSRVRWITFSDYITGIGIEVIIEHIDGKDNQIADTLSRLVHTTWSQHQKLEEEDEVQEKSQLLSYAELTIPIASHMTDYFRSSITPSQQQESGMTHTKQQQHSFTESRKKQPKGPFMPSETFKGYFASKEVTLNPWRPETTTPVTDCQLPSKTAKRAVHALRDLQGILRFKRSHLESMATRDNYASDRLPAALEDSQSFDDAVRTIERIIERAVQP